MKIHAISYQRDMADTGKEKLRFFVHDSDFFNQRREINKEVYDYLLSGMPYAGETNKYYAGHFYSDPDLERRVIEGFKALLGKEQLKNTEKKD